MWLYHSSVYLVRWKFEEEIDYSKFRTIWKVLCFESQDDQLSEALDEIQMGKVSPSDEEKILDKKTFLIFQPVSLTVGKSLKTIVVDRATDSWNEKYGELLEFYEEHGHACVKLDHPTLGHWIGNQRTGIRTGRILKNDMSYWRGNFQSMPMTLSGKISFKICFQKGAWAYECSQE